MAQILVALKPSPRMVEILDDAPAALSLTDTIICERLPFEPGWREALLASIAAGVRVFHLVADYHADYHHQHQLRLHRP